MLVFNKFFNLGEVYVGPTVFGIDGGSWIGKVRIIPTKHNFFMTKKEYFVWIREFKNEISEDIEKTLLYTSLDREEFDNFINKYYMLEWESVKSENKPNISSFVGRVYL
jgi:hypothetical protein